jgi:RimJ/RimL family protein N-acetyltransferase
VDLVPTSPEHHDGLVRAVEDGDLWRLWYTGVPRPADVAAHIDRVLGLQNKGSMLPFTVFDKARGCIAGMTTYTNVDLDGPRLEVGAT